mmetsp:Transcript_7080/g.11508  ORF Transcript_7080/g.11508 Transcript_7080/m.11508 type:complete len:352 (+) Transcript_7080:1865-2920(+)
MAGKSGLNLTFDAPLDDLLPAYAERAAWLRPMVAAFDSAAIVAWAEGLGQSMFTGTTGRVFPKAMKASPLLRAWLTRLDALGVQRKTRWCWTGWDGAFLRFDTVDGVQILTADAVVLALGGASWARLGSDGAWASELSKAGVALAPFAPANAALAVEWSPYMTPHLGKPLKGVAWRAGAFRSRGEAALTAIGLEGGGVYSVSRGVREGAALSVDLCPDLTLEDVVVRLSKPRGKASLSNHLRKALKLDPVKLAVLHEWVRPLPTASVALGAVVKGVAVQHDGLRPMDEAISTAGGVPLEALNTMLMLNDLPGVFCAGEMLDWEAPTGGYLLTACLATGRHAGHGVVEFLKA